MSRRVVLVTGALTGIGRATAMAFARQHACLIISGRRDPLGQDFAKELRRVSAEVEYIRADVRHEDEVRGLIDNTLQRFGRLDVAVNSAGAEGRLASLVTQTTESYASVFDTNVLGVLLSMKHELRAMLAQRSGCIVNLSSVLGHTGAPGAAVYAASKFAVEGLTRCAALEAADAGVRVIAVAPGPVDTAMFQRFTGTPERKASLVASVPLKRLARPEEVAETIVFLSSDKAQYITGQSFGVDGGARA